MYFSRSAASVFPARFAGLALARTRWVSACALLALATELPAEPTLLDHSICSEVALHDSRLTVHARRSLAEDEQLAPLNLGISVRNHVATLWGPVPSAELAERAVKRVRQVQGLAQVVNQLVVDKPGDPLQEFLRLPSPGPLPPPAPPRDQQPVRAAALAGRDESAPVPALGLSRRSSPAPEATVVMPPIPLPSPAASAAPPAGLAEAVERLRQGSDRFRRLRVEVSGQGVRLHGNVDRREDIFELARAISHLPGVERVTLAEVHVGK